MRLQSGTTILSYYLITAPSIWTVSHAFSTPWQASRSVVGRPRTSTKTVGFPYLLASSAASSSSGDGGGVLSDECMITPEGFGFSAPARRILKEAKRSNGFYKANGKELVIDVMEAITAGLDKDVALVYGENDQVEGLFTESDYIKVSKFVVWVVSFCFRRPGNVLSLTQNAWFGSTSWLDFHITLEIKTKYHNLVFHQTRSQCR